MSTPHRLHDPVQEPVFEEPLASELEQHKGRWVAVFQNAVVAVGESAVSVQREARSNGVTDPLIFRVPLNPNRIAFF